MRVRVRLQLFKYVSISNSKSKLKYIFLFFPTSFSCASFTFCFFVVIFHFIFVGGLCVVFDCVCFYTLLFLSEMPFYDSERQNIFPVTFACTRFLRRRQK
ncbi:unnamed protein product [Phytomonas sp. EM1]|nr:unnamed protein product [Phytomonas sp. EM1]|eukprot:CCW60368.1 unnamed protein product [Phytomonas sp. isolate EM1]